jgi:hypothetical protein
MGQPPAQADAETKLPDDDARVMDTMAFSSAISTIENNLQAPLDVVLRRYLGHLDKRALLLEYSRPSMDMIRTLPTDIPKPLSGASLPPDLQARRAALDNSASNPSAPPPQSLSSCTSNPAQIQDLATPTKTCQDSDGDDVTVSNSYVFGMGFTQYNATTGKDTDVSWSSEPANAPFSASGVCIAFTDCDDNDDVYYAKAVDHGVGPASPGTLPITVEQGQSPVTFYWLLDSYSDPTFSLCDVCDECPACQYNPVSVNTQVPTVQWSFNYDCTITP